MKTNKMVALALVLVSCGTEHTANEQEIAKKTAAVPTIVPPNVKEENAILQFKGFVGGAFPITVDGVPYEDSEDFYTKELEKLPEKILKAGYDKTWKWHFDAVVGFQDLRTNMMVFIAPQEKKGYQGEVPVSYAGGFEIALPKEAVDSNYMVRAVKRVNVVLERGSDVVKICYNFSALNQNVPFQEKSKPIILDQFTTRITAYACESASSNTGIIIPPVAVSPSISAPSSPEIPGQK